MYAGVMLEGGIISYDTNLVTGGAGGKFAGIGGSVQHRQDQLSIFLRAVSTKTGMVLKTVNTSKTILSRALDLGVFQFVSVTDLLEAEVGFSTNEPATVCANEAIEKGVHDLVMEGILMGLWDLKNPEDMKSPAIQNYIKGKEGMEVKIQKDEAGSVKVSKK
jgi:curli production assembly/transport component CsgG